jgi:predicted RNA-binding Zn-ribbon protein involved in translation (DUF1610 family)
MPKIVNVCDFDIELNRGALGQWTAPARPKDEKFSVLEIPEHFEQPRDIGWGEKEYRRIDGLQFAQAIVNDNKQMGGLFVFTGEKTTGAAFEAQLEAAETAYREYLAAELERGQHIYRETGKAKRITTHAKIACQVLGVDTEWAPLRAGVAKIDCPNCGALIRREIAVCPDCRAVLNAEKARQYGLIPEFAPPAPAAGAPKR